jgi:hypothetical protein
MAASLGQTVSGGASNPSSLAPQVPSDPGALWDLLTRQGRSRMARGDAEGAARAFAQARDHGLATFDEWPLGAEAVSAFVSSSLSLAHALCARLRLDEAAVALACVHGGVLAMTVDTEIDAGVRLAARRHVAQTREAVVAFRDRFGGHAALAPWLHDSPQGGA